MCLRTLGNLGILPLENSKICEIKSDNTEPNNNISQILLKLNAMYSCKEQLQNLKNRKVTLQLQSINYVLA